MFDRKLTIVIILVMIFQMIAITVLIVINDNNQSVINRMVQEQSNILNMISNRMSNMNIDEPHTHETKSVEMTPDGIVVKIHTHMLTSDGFLKIPPAFKKVAIEVGANDRDTMDTEYLPSNTDTFLITFEPILDKYATLMARFPRGKDKFQPLGYHNPRGMVFPIAIVRQEDEGKMMSFTMSGVDGCSSLMDLDGGAHDWAPWCFDVIEKRQVPTISLHTVLGLIQSDIEITHMKIDAQGYDMIVVESGGDRISRISSLCMEVVGDNHNPLYKSQPKCTSISEKMNVIGFIEDGWNYTTSCSWSGYAEKNLCWNRKKISSQ